MQGKNGWGKSSILKLIINGRTEYGKITLASGLKISYMPQDTSQLSGTLKEYAEQYQLEESLFFALLRKLDFSRTQFEKRLEDYSGGKKKNEIRKLFKSSRYVFNIHVMIETDTKTYDTKVAGKLNDNLITVDGDIIPIKTIRNIIIKDRF